MNLVTFKCYKTDKSNYNYGIVLFLIFYNIVSVLGNPMRTLILDQNIDDETLDVLNEYRKLHRVPPVIYDSHLGEQAAKWAIKSHHKAIKEGKLIAYYSHPHIEGENVMVSEGDLQNKPIRGPAAIHHWYSEIKYYNFSANQFSFKSAQFTQLVWKRTKRIGIAIVYDPAKNYTIIVARFKPPGNIGFAMSFKENVLQPLKPEVIPIKRRINASSSVAIPIIKRMHPESETVIIPKNVFPSLNPMAILNLKPEIKDRLVESSVPPEILNQQQHLTTTGPVKISTTPTVPKIEMETTTTPRPTPRALIIDIKKHTVVPKKSTKSDFETEMMEMLNRVQNEMKTSMSLKTETLSATTFPKIETKIPIAQTPPKIETKIPIAQSPPKIETEIPIAQSPPKIETQITSRKIENRITTAPKLIKMDIKTQVTPSKIEIKSPTTPTPDKIATKFIGPVFPKILIKTPAFPKIEITNPTALIPTHNEIAGRISPKSAKTTPTEIKNETTATLPLKNQIQTHPTSPKIEIKKQSVPTFPKFEIKKPTTKSPKNESKKQTSRNFEIKTPITPIPKVVLVPAPQSVQFTLNSPNNSVKMSSVKLSQRLQGSLTTTLKPKVLPKTKLPDLIHQIPAVKAVVKTKGISVNESLPKSSSLLAETTAIHQRLEVQKLDLKPFRPVNKTLKEEKGKASKSLLSNKTPSGNANFSGRTILEIDDKNIDNSMRASIDIHEERSIPQVASRIKIKVGNVTKFVVHSLDDSLFAIGGGLFDSRAFRAVHDSKASS